MKVGIFSDTIAGASPEEVAARTRLAGVETVQLRLAWDGLDLMASAADRTRVRRAYESHGVAIAAIAAYSNLLHPEAQPRAAGQGLVARAIAIAAELGTRVVVTEVGTYNADDSWSDHPHNATAEAWAELLEVTGRLTRHAEREGVTLAYEPYVNTVLSSAARARRLAEEIASPALAFVLDVAGLMTPSTLSNNAAIGAEALQLLQGRIALAHADDVRYENGQARWLPLGWGEIDSEALLAGLVASGFDGALIVEHLAESLVPEALAFCRERLERVRVA